MPKTSVRQSVDSYLRHKYPLAVPLALLLVGTVIYIAIRFPTNEDLIQVLLYILILPTVAYIALVERRFRTEMIRDFARAHSFCPELHRALPTEPFCLFTTGTRDPQLNDCFTGSLQGNPFTFFLYRLQKSFGRTTSVHYYHGMLVELPCKLPHIIIDAKKTEGTFLTDQYGKQHLVGLEGDFYKQFNFLVPATTKPTAYRFLTPDFMHRLMQQDIVYDVEIIGNKMLLYHDSTVQNPEQLAELLESTSLMIAELMKKMSIIQATNDLPPTLKRSLTAKISGSIPFSDKLAIVCLVLFLASTFFWTLSFAQ